MLHGYLRGRDKKNNNDENVCEKWILLIIAKHFCYRFIRISKRCNEQNGDNITAWTVSFWDDNRNDNKGEQAEIKLWWIARSFTWLRNLKNIKCYLINLKNKKKNKNRKEKSRKYLDLELQNVYRRNIEGGDGKRKGWYVFLMLELNNVFPQQLLARFHDYYTENQVVQIGSRRTLPSRLLRSSFA